MPAMNSNQFGHVHAFGRKTTKPGWFDRDGNGGADIFQWEANQPKRAGRECPFIHGALSQQREPNDGKHTVNRRKHEHMSRDMSGRYKVESRRSNQERVGIQKESTE